MSTTYETEPTTIAAAWSTSPLGDPTSEPTERWDGGIERVMPATKPTSIARHAVVIVALACGMGLGAALGLAVFDSTERTQPMVTVPRVEAPSVGPTSPAQALPAHDPASKPEHLPLPKSVAAAPPNVVSPTPTASAPEGAPVAAAPTVANQPGPVTLFSPPANAPGGEKVTVDIAIPAPPNAVPVPDEPDPEPESPKPKPTLQLAPGTDSTTLQPVQPPTLMKPRTTLNNPYTPGSKRQANQSPKPSQRTALSKP